jgi:hypothetical protein
MKKILFVVLTCSLAPRLSAADIIVGAPEGDLDPAFLSELKNSLETAARDSASSEGESAQLRATAKATTAGVALEVVLVPADASREIRETREASAASALAQARAMARAVIREFAAREHSEGAAAAKVEKSGPTARPVAARARAGTAKSEPAPASSAGMSDAYRTAARPGIIAGLSLDIAGFLGFVIAGIFAAASSDDAGNGPVVGACISGGAVVLGSFVLSTSYSVRHVAYVNAGLSPRPNFLVLSWIFSAGTAALYTASIIQWERKAAREEDDAEDVGEALSNGIERGAAAMYSAFEFCLSLAFEAVNLAVLKTLWRRDFRRSENSPRVEVAAIPFVLSARASHMEHPAAGFALNVAF